MSMAKPDTKTQISIYRKISLIKQNDDRLQAAMRSGKLVMPYYSARGQECIPAAISEHLTAEDYLVTIYRGIHDMLAKGVPLKELWAELAGRSTGTCKGKGGPMHITHPASGCMVTTGIVGAGIPIGCGLALAAQQRGEKRVAVTNFGDGASNIGAFHESLNLASVWKLPVIFVARTTVMPNTRRITKARQSRKFPIAPPRTTSPVSMSTATIPSLFTQPRTPPSVVRARAKARP